MITTRKQARAMGLADGRNLAMDVYREELTLAQDQAQLDNAKPDLAPVVALLKLHTDREAWGESALAWVDTAMGGKPIAERWRRAYQRAFMVGAIRQSRSLLNDLELEAK